MKKYGAIVLILGIIFYLTYILWAQNRQDKQDNGNNHTDNRDNYTFDEPLTVPGTATGIQGNQNAIEPKKMDFNNGEGSGENIEDENYFANDHEIFARKSYQKKLAPLSQQDKIIWAFRLSKTTIFL
jgi:hypothetical protein